MTISPEGAVYSGPAQPLPLSPGATLKWAGFSDECSPCTLDSDDIIRFLPIRSHCWMPICNTKEHVSNNYLNIVMYVVVSFRKLEMN